jgi:O-antigen ligase
VTFPGLKRGPRIAALALVAVFACTFLYAATLAQSRSLVVLFLGVIGLAVWQLLAITGSRGGRGRQRRGLLILAACASTVFALGAIVAGQKILEDRAGNTLSAARLWKEGRPPVRLLLAANSLKLVGDKPLWGWGLGCYRFAMTSVAGPEFRIDERWHQEKFYGSIISTHFAHNDWLQYWAETGTPAMVCLIATPWLLLRESRRRGRRNATSFWCLGGCGLILVFAVWDFPLSNPAVLLLTAVVFVIGVKLPIVLAAEEPGTRRKQRRGGKRRASAQGEGPHRARSDGFQPFPDVRDGSDRD